MIGRKLVATTACMVLVGAAALATAGPAPAAQTWAGDRITFISSRTGVPDLFVMHDDGSHQRNLTNGSTPNEDGPAISPNGKRIAFAASDGNDSELYMIKATGGNVHRLTNNDTGDYLPAWSPDNRKIAYACASQTAANLCVLNLKSGRVKHVTRGAHSARSPSWSPNGKKLAFADYDSGTLQYDVWTVHADGSHLRNLTKTSGAREYDPAWSPDGKLLAIDTDNGIRFISPKTGDPKGATITGSTPSWSPDGKRIDYALYDGNDGEIYSAKVDGSGVKNLTDNDVQDYFFD
jgi:Tol biopolymer transport system component